MLRVSPDLHEQLSREADESHVSLNEICVRKLAAPIFVSTFASPFAPSVRLAEKIFGSALIGIVVFGSYTRGQLRDSSDIDLMIILKRGFKYTRDHIRRWDDKNMMIDSHPVSIAVVQFYNDEEDDIPQNILWFEAAVEGVVLFDRNQLIQNRLRDLRDLIASGRMVKKLVHGQPYWTRG